MIGPRARVEFDSTANSNVIFRGRITGHSKDGYYVMVHVDGERKSRHIRCDRVRLSTDYRATSGDLLA